MVVTVMVNGAQVIDDDNEVGPIVGNNKTEPMLLAMMIKSEHQLIYASNRINNCGLTPFLPPSFSQQSTLLSLHI